ncbi:two-component system regulatory protein YycI [Neobacillus drentensis]|uniref:two-component system regulatory protein YycI n=1 Tax=Neobacillus drentensis TaxID=220684 RepID=UPI002859B0A5|nr:two-component system regulatory protein YycI [Neobacillus drentensis]MDR7239102.1 regulatory protein YycI of two-component signal transduction system YycFG [Neobacillus drentensis]
MDWSKIKTIFIITFLILDVYLLFQFMKIRDANKYEVITEASFEEKLKADEITYKDLPKDPIQAQYLSAKPKVFTKVDIDKLKGQSVVISGAGTTTLHALLKKPLQLTAKFEPAELSAFLNKNVLNGEDYLFGEKSDKDQTITYYQQSENYPLYKNINGMITFKLDEKNQIVSYEQTLLEEMEKLTAKEEILQPLKAIETLHQKGMLKSKSNITRIELGYSTLIQLAASQVLAPTWRFEVDGKESLFVNAFEGQIIQFNSDENSKVE